MMKPPTKTKGVGLGYKLWKYGGIVIGLASIYMIALLILNLIGPPIALASAGGAVVIKPATIIEYCTSTWGSTSVSPGQTTSFQVNCMMWDPLGLYYYFVVTYINGQGWLNAFNPQPQVTYWSLPGFSGTPTFSYTTTGTSFYGVSIPPNSWYFNSGWIFYFEPSDFIVVTASLNGQWTPIYSGTYQGCVYSDLNIYSLFYNTWSCQNLNVS